MLNNIEKLVIVAGCQRSGTTLTGQIIGAHPDAFLIDEDDGLYEWFHSTDDNLEGDKNTFLKLIEKADEKYKNSYSKLESNWSNNSTIKSNVSHLVLKAPNLTYSFSRLAKLNIPVIVIYPKRDPRSVVASMTKLTNIDMVANQCRLIRKQESLAKEFVNDLSKIEQNLVPNHIKRALIWKIKTGLIQKFVCADIPTFAFSYEDLVTNKSALCSKFSQYTNLSDHHLLATHEKVYTGVGPGGTNRTRSIDAKSTSLWKKTLTHQQANDILKITNYKPSNAE